ncbi:PEP-CTERM sorting domain-containing protein [Coraliomargarita sp. W4R53]
MKLTHSLLTAAAISCFALSASAQTTFVFDDGSSTGAAGLALEAFVEGVDAASMGLNTSGTYSQDGITLKAGTDFGKFNLTNSGFGPDQADSGDDSDTFDTALGNESMVFSFDVAGTFLSIDFAGLDDTPETAILSFAGGSTYNLTDGVTSDITVSGNDFFGGINESFTAGQLITLSISGGNGWTLENFTVVPEPGTFALLSGFAALAFVMLRRRSA